MRRLRPSDAVWIGKAVWLACRTLGEFAHQAWKEKQMASKKTKPTKPKGGKRGKGY